MTTTNETAAILMRTEREWDDSTPELVPVRVLVDPTEIALYTALLATGDTPELSLVMVPLGSGLGLVAFESNETDFEEYRRDNAEQERIVGVGECSGADDGIHEDVVISLVGDPVVQECRACGNRSDQ